MKILGIAGDAGSGKTTFADAIVREYTVVGDSRGHFPCVRVFSFADALKDLCAEQFGFDRELLDNPAYKATNWYNTGWTVREILQFVGTDVFRRIDPDHWVKKFGPAVSELRRTAGVSGILIADVRFPNEMDAILRQGGKVVHLSRMGGESMLVGGEAAHASETALAGADFNHYWSFEYGDIEGIEARALDYYDSLEEV